MRVAFFYWRCFATALCFGLFGVGGLIFGLIVFPALRLAGGSAKAQTLRSRWILQRAMRLFVELMRALGLLTYSVHGREYLGRRAQVIVANHPTLIDVVFLIAFTPGACCVVKEALWRNPCTRHVVSAAGYVSNRSTMSMIEESTDALKQGQSVIIFPEGTRTEPGQPLHFHRGAANIAMRAAAIVTPVFIRCEPLTLSRSDAWYRIPVTRVRLSLEVGADIDPEPFLGTGRIPLAARQFNEYLLNLFVAQSRGP